MKLWVDDIRNAPDDTWHVARTVLEAIRAIARYRTEITEISLDHDISHQVQIGNLSRPYPCDETFASVAYFIAVVYNEDSQPKIFLHTANKVAGDEMVAMLLWHGITTKKNYTGVANRLEMEL